MKISDMFATTFVGGKFEMGGGAELTVTPDQPLGAGTIPVRIKVNGLLLASDVWELVAKLETVAMAMDKMEDKE